MVDKIDIDKILRDGIDFKERRIYFGSIEDIDKGSGFCWGTVESTIRALHKMSSVSKKPIEIHMSSFGGDVSAMLRLYDAIQECPCQIKFYGSGEIQSSATWIMAGCDERYLSKNTCVMLHKGSGGINIDGNEVDLQIDAQNNALLVKKLNQMFADNSRMPVEFWDEMTSRDLHLSAEEAIMLGLADKIVEYKKRGNLRKSRINSLKQPVDKTDMRKLLNTLGKRLYRGKNLKIELHTPDEEFDSEVIIEQNNCDNNELIIDSINNDDNKIVLEE